MKLFSYCIPIDDGAAPNPFWGICTLTICKPVIRRVAEVGDWIVGVGSKNVNGKDYSGRLVYAMKVSEVKSYKDYDRYCQNNVKEKIPDIKNKDSKRCLGDCIYEYTNDYDEVTKTYKFNQRPSVHGTENIETDIRGVNALLSNHFYYFGDQAVTIPEKFNTIIRQGQGHQSIKNQFIKDEFIEWVSKVLKKIIFTENLR